MKFDVSKKEFSQALNAVNAVVSRLVMPNAGSADDAGKSATNHGGFECLLEADADKGRLHIKFAQGGICCQATVKDAKVHEAGATVINVSMYAAAMRASGDTFKGAVSGSKMSFSCGRSRGKLDVFPKFNAADFAIPKSAPKPEVLIQEGIFQRLLWATAIYDTSRVLDRVITFGKSSVRVETTDGYRGIAAAAKVKCPKTGVVVLPADIVDSFSSYLADAINVGWSDKFFTAKAAGFYVCVPVSQNKPVHVYDKLKEKVETKPIFKATAKAPEIARALGDVQNLVFGGEKRVVVDLAFGQKEGRVLIDGTAGKIDSSFDLESSTLKGKDDKTVPLTIDFLRDAVSLSGVISISGYDKFIAVTTESEDGISEYLAAIPQVNTASTSSEDGEGDGEDGKKSKKKAKGGGDGEEAAAA